MTAGPPLFLGIDFGTSGCRTRVIGLAGETAARSAVPLPPPVRPAPGWSEQDPNLWWAALTAVVAGLPGDARARVAAVAVDGTSGTLLLADERGRPTGPALLYDDARACDQAQALARVAPPDSAVNSPSSSLAKALWLLVRPHRGTRHLLHQADWVLGRLTGRYGTSDENNALKLGYDPVARCWPAWLGAAGVPAGLLPMVSPVGKPVGPIIPAIAAELGLPPGTLVVAGTTDSTAGAIAAGVAAPGDGVTTLGSTLVVKVLSERPVLAARYGVYSHRLGDLWLVGGASNSGGAVLRQFFADDELAALSAGIDPARPSPLDYYPLPRPGERFPWPTRPCPRDSSRGRRTGRRSCTVCWKESRESRRWATDASPSSGPPSRPGFSRPAAGPATQGGRPSGPASSACPSPQSRTVTPPTAQRCWRGRGRGASAELRRHHFSPFSNASASFAEAVPGCSRCTRSRIGRASAPRPALASAAPTWKLISGCCGAIT